MANACPHQVLSPRIERPFPFLKRRVRIQAYCTKTEQPVAEPKVGCGECHYLPDIFTGEILDPDASS
jgi:hypothetical protein